MIQMKRKKKENKTSHSAMLMHLKKRVNRACTIEKKMHKPVQQTTTKKRHLGVRDQKTVGSGHYPVTSVGIGVSPV